MAFIDQIFNLVMMAVWAVIGATMVLMILRLIVQYSDMNPFSWPALTVRRLSDPLVLPVRGALLGLGADPKFAPLATILIVVLLGYFAVQLAGGLHATAAGVFDSIVRGSPRLLVGHILYGLLTIYLVLIFMRIIFSWGMISYSNRIMRFLVNATEPLLGPLRRMVPPLGPFDISPFVAVIIVWLFQAAVAGTLLAGGIRGSLL
jgi:YggT family protein